MYYILCGSPLFFDKDFQVFNNIKFKHLRSGKLMEVKKKSKKQKKKKTQKCHKILIEVENVLLEIFVLSFLLSQ